MTHQPAVRGDEITPDHPAFGEYCYEHGAEMQDHDCDLLWGSNNVPAVPPAGTAETPKG
jgi:hypothetical protein